MQKKDISILFVCLGNICRSPAAEGVFRKMVEDAGRSEKFEIDSAGTIAYHAGDPADSRMRGAASRRGYSLDSRARPLEPGDYEKFDLIVTMDEANYRDVTERDTGQGARIVRMTQYCRRHRADEVPDPYYGGPDGFENVLNLLEDACSNLLEDLERD